MRPVATVVLALFIAAQVAAQGVTVRGYAYDSLHSRPLVGAFVGIGTKTTTTDSAGRFAITDVAPGTYRVIAQHDAIDRLGISAIGAQVNVTDGRSPVTLAVPSFRALWRFACGEHAPANDTGFVFGTVRSSRPRRNATVSASWIDIVATGTKISQKLRTLEVNADSLGGFALCGVPTTTGLTIRAAADSLESGTFDVGPLDQEKVIRRDLTLGAPIAQAIAAGRGASISGKVLADSGKGPLANVDVALTNLGITTTTNERGEYAFKDLPPGSHRLYARKIGYGDLKEVAIDVEEAEQRGQDIVLSRITMLDSMKVNAKPLARDEAMRAFEEHRKLGLGKFLTQEDLDKANGRSVSQMMIMFPSLTIKLDPRTGKYVPSYIGRGPTSMIGGGCKMKVYIDGALDREPDLNQFPPSAIAGIEYFRGPAQTPPEYAGLGSGCGVILIHLRNK